MSKLNESKSAKTRPESNIIPIDKNSETNKFVQFKSKKTLKDTIKKDKTINSAAFAEIEDEDDYDCSIEASHGNLIIKRPDDPNRKKSKSDVRMATPEEVSEIL